MRLIDADELVKFPKGCTMSNGTLINTNTMLSVIDKMPTAYDIEKVVAELENEYDNIPFQYENNYEDGFSDGLLKAIDIVRKGGVE